MWNRHGLGVRMVHHAKDKRVKATQLPQGVQPTLCSEYLLCGKPFVIFALNTFKCYRIPIDSSYHHTFPSLNFPDGETEAKVLTASKVAGPGTGPMSVSGQNYASSPVCEDTEPQTLE